MNLTEGQLFTIEALNKIDGFVWPDKAEFAAMDDELFTIDFYSLKPEPLSDSLSFGSKFWMRAYNGKFNSEDHHPDWRNSLITREQFDSVDGWVRNSDRKGPPQLDVDGILFDVKSGEKNWFCVDGSEINWDAYPHENGYIAKLWRYHKPTKKTEVQPEAPKQPSIDELYSQYKERRKITESAKELLAESMEAEDKLLEQIKAWNLEHGFDVRLLDESKEKPELVITDWRDLQVGDIIECIGSWEGESTHGLHVEVTAIEELGYEGDFPIQVRIPNPMRGHGLKWGLEFKFIHRP
ncbi:MAG: hypothetical protein ACRC8W_08520 [Plesiomonas shigelloides]